MIDGIVSTLTSDFTVGLLAGSVVTWGINSYRLHRERYDHMDTLAHTIVITVHAEAFSRVLDEEGINPDRAEEKIEERLEDDTVLDAFHHAGWL